MSKKIFIFTTGRTGSVTLYNFFKSNLNVLALHEGTNRNLGINLTDFKNFNKKIFYDKGFKIDNKYNLDPDSVQYLLKLYKSREQLFEKHQDKIIVDINPYQYLLSKFLLKKYPKATFVLLIRNGLDVVNSYHQRDKTTYPNISENEYKGWASGKPRPLHDDIHLKNWRTYDRVQKISWFWSYINSNLYKSLNTSSNFSILKTENLPSIKNVVKSYKDYDFSILDKRHNKAKRNTDIWTKEAITTFNKIAGDTMQSFGYDLTA